MPWAGSVPEIRDETHYGGRKLACFAARPAHLDAMFADAVARAGGAEAVVAGETRLTYTALDAWVGRLAAGLAGRGIEPGDRVALALGNRPEFLALTLACFRIGAIAVPLSIRMRGPEFDYILGHCEPKIVVHEAEIASEIAAPGAQRFACGGTVDGAEPFAALEGDGAAPAHAPPIHVPDESETAVILYTSGTTGQPKGAMLTHLGIVHSALHFEACLGLGAGERAVLAVPASHVTGLVAILLTMVRTAGATVMMPAFKARDFLTLAAAERLSYTILVPTMYTLCLRQADFSGHDLSAWRIGGFGGAPMPEATIAQLAEALPGLVLCNAYGATETTSPVTIMPPGDIAGRADSVGRVVPCGHLRVVDDAGADLPPGATGELWIAGPMVVPGYWREPEADAANFENGYWKSGDIGSLDRDGYVRIHDRKKDMINRGGYKVFSAEVENVLSHHPGVVEAAVVARPDPVLGERVHAFVFAGQAAPTAADLAAFCTQRLSDYKVPESFAFLDAPLPRNANGKVRKGALKERLVTEME